MPHCKQEYCQLVDLTTSLGGYDRPLFRSVGCRNRKWVTPVSGNHKLLVTDETIRDLAHERVSTWEIKQAALKSGMRTLRVDAWDKAMNGLTTVEEVLRVTKGDRIA